MTKRLPSKYSVCKKLKSSYKNLWGVKKKDSCRSVIGKKRKRLSPFGRLLNIKQSLKFFYSNINESSFKVYIKSSVKSPSKTIDKLCSFLETRIDTIIYRSCLVNSFQEARQLINHGFVFVNDTRISVSNKKIHKNDIVKLNLTSFDKNTFLKSILSRSIPNYLELDLNNFTIILLWDVNFKNTYYPIREKYVDINRYYN
uniref:Ribosomal protein S4 n=1 Tax=Cryptomonas curvata TaxID=233186 RepID=A0A2P1G8D6_9CRYP|nr:ribosomal protein S4 [Cryptomonas curvata]AVM81224.1 ribosomal protein S4 [Cryptomonas curvata]